VPKSPEPDVLNASDAAGVEQSDPQQDESTLVAAAAYLSLTFSVISTLLTAFSFILMTVDVLSILALISTYVNMLLRCAHEADRQML
jgi:hypothetical protein